MRSKVVDTLLQIVDDNTYFLTADVGFGVLEPLKEKLGERFINVGLAEQSMLGIASGLALSGKRVYTYTMCAFYLRAFEQIKLDLCYQNVPVTMIGVGTQFDYSYLGNTHFAFDDDQAINSLLNIDVFTPKTQQQLDMILRLPVDRPLYIRVGGYEENLDCEIDWNKLTEYPKEGGSREYFIKKYGQK
jgi:transketolase